MHLRLLSLSLVLLAATAADLRADQTLVFLRHGEKPAGGHGQITCQGFNRSVALPAVLAAKFGAPWGFYAPNPSVRMDDPAGSFYYVRPLATIEPTAIKAGLGVNTRYAYSDIAGLRGALITPTKADTTIVIAWEHAYLVKIVQDLMNRYGGGAAVPAWTFGDYDSLYVVHVSYAGGTVTARFERDRQGLDGQPTTCPY
jgi:hypothetical protein